MLKGLGFGVTYIQQHGNSIQLVGKTITVWSVVMLGSILHERDQLGQAYLQICKLGLACPQPTMHGPSKAKQLAGRGYPELGKTLFLIFICCNLLSCRFFYVFSRFNFSDIGNKIQPELKPLGLLKQYV